MDNDSRIRQAVRDALEICPEVVQRFADDFSIETASGRLSVYSGLTDELFGELPAAEWYIRHPVAKVMDEIKMLVYDEISRYKKNV